MNKLAKCTNDFCLLRNKCFRKTKYCEGLKAEFEGGWACSGFLSNDSKEAKAIIDNHLIKENEPKRIRKSSKKEQT